MAVHKIHPRVGVLEALEDPLSAWGRWPGREPVHPDSAADAFVGIQVHMRWPVRPDAVAGGDALFGGG